LWGDELPWHEASQELDPPTPERIDRAAFQLAKSIKGERADFNGTEQPAAEPQPPEEMAKVADGIEKSWPNKVKPCPAQSAQ
jgi:hypothetical protein